MLIQKHHAQKFKNLFLQTSHSYGSYKIGETLFKTCMNHS